MTLNTGMKNVHEVSISLTSAVAVDKRYCCTLSNNRSNIHRIFEYNASRNGITPVQLAVAPAEQDFHCQGDCQFGE